MKRIEQIVVIIIAAALAIPSYWFFWTLAGGGGYNKRIKPINNPNNNYFPTILPNNKRMLTSFHDSNYLLKKTS